jgi:transcriptional antiterminator RfaH
MELFADTREGLMHWYAVNTKPSQESQAVLNLESLGIEVFCPRIKQKKTIRRRERTVIGPLFPGYLFAKFNMATQYRGVMFSRGVRNIVMFGSFHAVIDEETIESIKARLCNGCLTVPEPSFKQGQVVRIETGPLHGLEAVFERQMSDRQRAVLLLRALAYQARVVVPLQQVVNGENFARFDLVALQRFGKHDSC